MGNGSNRGNEWVMSVQCVVIGVVMNGNVPLALCHGVQSIARGLYFLEVPNHPS